jgi:diketogulonate reductase-like aldo/keto reductase
LMHRQTIAIPKASSAKHVRDNRGAAEITLSADVMAAIDAAFPPPSRATPLAVI